MIIPTGEALTRGFIEPDSGPSTLTGLRYGVNLYLQPTVASPDALTCAVVSDDPPRNSERKLKLQNTTGPRHGASATARRHPPDPTLN